MRSVGIRSRRAGQADQRRAELLRAARRVVMERGMAGTRVADIAKAVDVSGGLIHYHFATKDELITEMLRAALDSESARLRELSSGPGAPIQRLDGVLRFYLPDSRGDQSWVLWIDAWAAGLREPSVQAIVHELGRSWVAAVETTISEGVRAGVFACADPRGAAERIDAMLDGLIVRYTLGDHTLTRQRLLEHARTAAAHEVGLTPADFSAVAASGN
ncbi:TetR/AcrR family transcriptional regulator [Spongiactinospora sp. TRM90649]|uniref:TetR/AcrR family transcriptional regulator n=1 Tax=Spongiactinospora sp. TRM90649 TaxID=3031114 RepID=UPI0023F8D505|nr:TetR/AcrR family transcriptional regulator [Spongiactinospora sp. TRM90649]MDF5752313.1 TetR/AcrR family transcriptional regulator [Spongiactinospora sp. TRM90649]